MTHHEEERFIEAFESASLPPGGFRHRDHVRLAWLYLRRYPLIEVLTLLDQGLKRFAKSVGQEGLYHETITWAFVFLIKERMESRPENEDWEAFAARNPDLLEGGSELLERYYTRELLGSDQARASFVLPDRAAVRA